MQFFKTVTGDVVVYLESKDDKGMWKTTKGYFFGTDLVEVSLNYAIAALINESFKLADDYKVFYKGYEVEVIEYVAETDSVIIDGIEVKLTEELLKDFDKVKVPV